MRRFKPLRDYFILVSLFLVSVWSYADTFTVTNLNDSGDNSLRWAIGKANGYSGPDTINFAVSGTISLLSALPAITDDGTVIDASSKWVGDWPKGKPGIALDGSKAGDAHGLEVTGASYCKIYGLLVTGFQGGSKAGIRISEGGQFNYIGGAGIGFRNVISKNNDGVHIADSGSNTVSGNYIGTDTIGTSALGNLWTGVWIHGKSASNTIGGKTPAEGNIISGNGYWGVVIEGPAKGNIVSGNCIGTDFTGTVALGNSADGVFLHLRAYANIIGGKTPGERNVISGLCVRKCNIRKRLFRRRHWRFRNKK